MRCATTNMSQIRSKLYPVLFRCFNLAKWYGIFGVMSVQISLLAEFFGSNYIKSNIMILQLYVDFDTWFRCISNHYTQTVKINTSSWSLVLRILFRRIKVHFIVKPLLYTLQIFELDTMITFFCAISHSFKNFDIKLLASKDYTNVSKTFI